MTTSVSGGTYSSPSFSSRVFRDPSRDHPQGWIRLACKNIEHIKYLYANLLGAASGGLSGAFNIKPGLNIK